HAAVTRMETPMYEQILYEVEDPVATITLNRPERLNAWTDRMGDELRHGMARAEADKSGVGSVVRGVGGGVRGWRAGLKRAGRAGARRRGRGLRRGRGPEGPAGDPHGRPAGQPRLLGSRRE